MREKEQNQVIDELLDAGLAHYSNVTPRPGLEQRLLAAAHAEREHRSRLVSIGALAAGAVAAAMLLGVIALKHPRIPAPSLAPIVARVGKERSTDLRSSGLRPFVGIVRGRAADLKPAGPRYLARRAVRAKVVHRLPEPRQASFPSPAPLSEQERLLLVCLKLPPETQQAIFKKGPDVSEELEIKPLPPLAEDSEQVGPGLAPASSGSEGGAGRSEGGSSPVNSVGPTLGSAKGGASPAPTN